MKKPILDTKVGFDTEEQEIIKTTKSELNNMPPRPKSFKILKKPEAGNYTIDDISEMLTNNSRFKQKKTMITEDAIKLINMTVSDPAFDEKLFVDSIITYQSVFDRIAGLSLIEYINAIRFCAFYELYEGNTVKAYIHTFRHRDFVKNRVDQPRDSIKYKELTNCAYMYRKQRVVIDLLTQSEVPLYILFQGYRYKAISVLVREMEQATYAKDRINAADRLLTHLKPPENVKIELEVGPKKDTIVDQYEEMLANMVAKQKELISQGISSTEVSDVTNFIDVEVKSEQI